LPISRSGKQFFFKVIDAQLEFMKDETGKVSKVILHQNGKDMEEKK